MPRLQVPRLSIATRILAVATLSLLVLAVVLLVVVKQTVDGAIYRQIAQQVEHGQQTLWYLTRAKGEAHIVDGKLFLGTFQVDGNHEVVDQTKAISGADATLFQVMPDGKPIRLQT